MVLQRSTCRELQSHITAPKDNKSTALIWPPSLQPPPHRATPRYRQHNHVLCVPKHKTTPLLKHINRGDCYNLLLCFNFLKSLQSNKWKNEYCIILFLGVGVGGGMFSAQLEHLQWAGWRLCISEATDNLISCTPISEMSHNNMMVPLTGGGPNIGSLVINVRYIQWLGSDSEQWCDSAPSQLYEGTGSWLWAWGGVMNSHGVVQASPLMQTLIYWHLC